MRSIYSSMINAIGKFIGFIIGLLTLQVVAFLLLQLVLLLFIAGLDDLKAIALIIQFPASLHIWLKGRK